MPKKKGKGKKQIDRAPVTRIPEYEEEIVTLNRELSEWRTKMNQIRDTNASIWSDMQELKGDRIDISEYVERNLNDRINEAVVLRKDIAAVQRERTALNKQYAEEEAEKEAYFKKWDNILRSDGLTLTGNIMLCDKFRKERVALMEKYDALETELRGQVKRQAMETYDVEREVLIDKYTLTCSGDEELAILLGAIKDTSQLRITNKAEIMIVENFELSNVLDKLVATYFKMEATVMMTEYDFKEARNTAELLKSEQERLAFMIKRHLNIFESMDNRYDELINEVAELHYKTNKSAWYENILACAKEKIDQQLRSIKRSENHVKQFKVNIQNLKRSWQQTEAQITFCSAVIETIKNFVLEEFRYCKLFTLEESQESVNKSVKYFLELINTIPNTPQQRLTCCVPIDYGVKEESSDSNIYESKETITYSESVSDELHNAISSEHSTIITE